MENHGVPISRETRPPPSRGGATVATRAGQPQSQRRPVPVARLSCNKCRKPITATFWVTNCSHVFCETCTITHFGKNNFCPQCRSNLRNVDIFDCVVAKRTKHDNPKKQSLQTMFTNESKNPQMVEMTYGTMCKNLLSNIDHVRFATKFLLQQFVNESRQQAGKNAANGREIASVKQKMQVLEQKTSSERLEYDRAIAESMARLQAQDQQIGQLKEELREKQSIIEKFRSHQAQRTVSSRGSHGSASGRGSVENPYAATTNHSSHGGRRFAHMNAPPPSQVFQQQQPLQQQQQQTPAPSRGLFSRGKVPGSSILDQSRDLQRSKNPLNRPPPPVNNIPSPAHYSDTASSDGGGIRQGIGADSRFMFNSSSQGRSSQSQHVNKRRRSDQVPASARDYGNYSHQKQYRSSSSGNYY